MEEVWNNQDLTTQPNRAIVWEDPCWERWPNPMCGLEEKKCLERHRTSPIWALFQNSQMETLKGLSLWETRFSPLMNPEIELFGLHPHLANTFPVVSTEHWQDHASVEHRHGVDGKLNRAKYKDRPNWKPGPEGSGRQALMRVHLPAGQWPLAHSQDNTGVA